jgi:hypothetical protein
VEQLVAREARIARVLDDRIIAPRLDRLYEFSATSLGQPHVVDFLAGGMPSYALNGRAP